MIRFGILKKQETSHHSLTVTGGRERETGHPLPPRVTSTSPRSHSSLLPTLLHIPRIPGPDATNHLLQVTPPPRDPARPRHRRRARTLTTARIWEQPAVLLPHMVPGGEGAPGRRRSWDATRRGAATHRPLSLLHLLVIPLQRRRRRWAPVRVRAQPARLPAPAPDPGRRHGPLPRRRETPQLCPLGPLPWPPPTDPHRALSPPWGPLRFLPPFMACSRALSDQWGRGRSHCFAHSVGSRTSCSGSSCCTRDRWVATAWEDQPAVQFGGLGLHLWEQPPGPAGGGARGGVLWGGGCCIDLDLVVCCFQYWCVLSSKFELFTGVWSNKVHSAKYSGRRRRCHLFR